jgi:uncharacterized protein YqjF (DUF2071 family)
MAVAGGAHLHAENTKQPGIFLTADWNNLVMLNYAIDPALIERFVPRGTELDAFAGNTYFSLVAFEFNNTRVSGFAVPFHRSFEEVNLRFYVRRGDRRGVTFIRELVPRRAVAAIARRFFNENYSCVPMSHRIGKVDSDDLMEAEYSWGTAAGQCSIFVKAGAEDLLPPEGSHAQFITEHYWGYAAQPDGGCIEYEVQHPRWRIRQANTAEFRGDASRYYGSELAEVLAGTPDSAFLIEGSAVTVFKGTRIFLTGPVHEAYEVAGRREA